MYDSLPEVHPSDNSSPYLSLLADDQRLVDNGAVKGEGSLGVPTPVNDPLALHHKDFREAVPHRSLGCGVTSGQFRVQTVQTTLPHIIVRYNTIQLRKLGENYILTIQV